MGAAICEWLDEVTVWQVLSEFHDPWVKYFFPTNRASSTYAPITHNVRLPGVVVVYFLLFGFGPALRPSTLSIFDQTSIVTSLLHNPNIIIDIIIDIIIIAFLAIHPFL